MASASARGSLRSEKQAAVRSSGVNPQLRSKIPFSKRSVAPSSKPSSADEDNSVSGRVRVAVRLRPRNAEDLASDADFADCIELQPEKIDMELLDLREKSQQQREDGTKSRLKRLKLLKNNWSSESYKFDEVFTESASQRRVYEVVAKPVVESVLDGYNGTVMAYGQTGTGKTYTVARLGKDDPSERGIMVRALEDIFAATSPTSDTVAISYLQLYLEAIQDLLVPEKNNIPIVEDPKTGEVSLPGAEIIKVRDLDHFTKLLEIGEANRHAANTKLNTESSRSHAILSVYIQRSAKGKGEEGGPYLEKDGRCDLHGGNDIPTVLRSKLLVVDLAGSERIDKSGSEGHTLEEAKFINLSLSSLGKCINALAENSPHIPIRDSKLTRLLRDSFGGSARTSLIITIGPSVRHHAETTGTIMFGQRAMKIVNMLKLKEEFDYESLCRKLAHQVDHLTAEIERQQKLRDDDNKQMEKKLEEYEKSLLIAEKSISTTKYELEKDYSRLELELNSAMDELNLHKGQNDRLHDEVARLELSLKQTKQHQLDGYAYQKILTDTTQMYEKKIAELMEQIEYENSRFKSAQEELEAMNKILSDQQRSLQLQAQREKDELEVQLQEVCVLHEKGVNELQFLKTEKEELVSEKAMLYEELLIVQKKLSNEEKQRKCLEDELFKWKKHVSENNVDLEVRNSYMKDEFGRVASGLISPKGLHKSNQSKENLSSGQRVSLQKLLASLKCKDEDAQIHAVKLVANLAAEDSNQEKIVVEGGLDSLLSLLGSSQNTTIHRVASGAIANLAMNEVNQGLIVSKGGVRLLANIASETDDPPTLRMVAGAVANLCGNERLHTVLIDDGGTKALMEMVRCGHSEVIAQIARGMANFAKCESRGITQGRRKGRSILIADGALKWMVSNSTCIMDSTRRHIELALCHLAQNEDNAEDFISSGAMRELIRISRESTKEDIRLLAKKILNKSATFLAEIQRDWQQL